MRKTIGILMTLAFLLSIPVMANAISYTMSDGNSSAIVDASSDRGMYDWTVDGTDHLFRQWFWYRVGSAGPENSIDTLALGGGSGLYGPGAGTQNLLLSYTGAGFTIDVDYGLTGGTAGSNVSVISERIVITNTSGSALDFHFFQYSDFDLGGDAGDDVAVHSNANTIDQRDLQTVLAETAVTLTPNHWEIANYASLLGRLRDGTPTTLPDSVSGTSPGDMTWGFQWDRTIAAGGSVVIGKSKNIAPVPEPATLFLLGSSLLGFAVNKRKKNEELS